MTDRAVPVGTRVKRSNGRWHVKTETGWHWEPRKRRTRAGRVVAFEVSHEDWARIEAIVAEMGARSVSSFALWAFLTFVNQWEVQVAPEAPVVPLRLIQGPETGR